MGFFPNIFKKPSIAKVVGAVVTGGLSLAVPKIGEIVNPLAAKLYDPKLLPAALGFAAGSPALANIAAISPASLLPASQLAYQQDLARRGGQPMALNIGGILGQVGTIFGGGQNKIFEAISGTANLASQFFPPRGVPAGAPPVIPMPVMSMAGPILRGGAMVGRSFFNRFPNLATAIQGYRNMGKNITRAKLWSVVKRFGPELVISGGILTAAAVNELMIAGPGHRRMNPANVKALRRSLRRLESFHTLCMRVDRLRRPRSRSRSKSAGGSTQFVRQG